MVYLKKREKVIEFAKSHAANGFLCSESVLLAISDLLEIKDELIPKIATGFGAGIGGCGSVCGAISGGIIALGLKFGRNDVKEQAVRPYWFGQELLERFKREYGHITCRELTGCNLKTEEGRGKYAEQNMWETRCRQYIEGATAIVFDLVSEKSKLGLTGEKEMEIVSLGPALEPIFWKRVNRDIPHYYFFALDWKYNRDKTKVLLALEGNRIDGMMLVYDQRIVQLRGNFEAAKALCEKVDLEKIEFQALDQYKQYILKKYKPTWSHQIMLMTLKRAEERLQKKHPIVELEISDAERAAAIMRDADPEYWEEQTGQGIVESMNQGAIWLGIKINGDLVSLGSARSTEWAGLIGVVATQEEHRNKGYATLIVSELVRQILGKLSTALIYVLTDNQPAIRAYSKVGFKPYRTYFFMRGERR